MLKKVVPAIIAICIASGYTMSTRKVAHGTCEGGVFNHPRLGITLEVPRDWYTMNDAELDKFVEESAAQGGSVLAEAKRRTALLLVAMRYSPKEEPSGPNCMLLCGAEKLPWFSGVSTGADYLERAREHIHEGAKAAGATNFELAKETYSATIGGTEFDVLDLTLNQGEFSIYLKHYVTILEGNAVFFVLTYFTDSDESVLKRILEGLKID